MWYVQSECGKTGLVHERNLDFNKKALQKHARYGSACGWPLLTL